MLINRDNRDFLRQSRLIEIIKILSRFIEISWHYQDFFEWLQVQKSWLIEKSQSRKMTKSTHSWSRFRQTVEIDQKIYVSMDFLISIETFRTDRWCRDKIEISRLSRSNFWKCQDFLDRWDKLLESVKFETLDETLSRQIETPNLSCKTILYRKFFWFLFLEWCKI